MQPTSSRVEQVVRHIVANGDKVRRYAPLVQGIVGASLVGLGSLIGRERLHLILDGERTTGRIVSYERRDFSDHSSSLSNVGYMPVVEFQLSDRTVRFTNWMGSRTKPLNGTTVVVLYDSDSPETAMIDRAGLNWIPWAPLLVVGLFLLAVALKGWVASRSVIERR